MSDLELLKLSEVAAELRSTLHFARTLVNTGELKFIRIGKEYRVSRGALERWIEVNQGYKGEADLPQLSRKSRVNRKSESIKVAKSAA
jgi:excisionase family DNA binding protein